MSENYGIAGTQDIKQQFGSVNKMEKAKEQKTEEFKPDNPWTSYEPRGRRLGDLEVEYNDGEIKVFRNCKLLYDDGDGISFYYQLDMGAWAVLRIPESQIKDYEVIE
jgi:hypothetical protein